MYPNLLQYVYYYKFKSCFPHQNPNVKTFGFFVYRKPHARRGVQ